VRALAFPLFLLLFMIPIPQIVYAQITLPLQLFASTVAANTLNLVGIPALQTGNILELPNGQQLSVVEACSGIRSLLSLSFLSLVYAWFFDPKRWMRLALLIATVPIAILANATRVTVTGIISASHPKLAEGFFHSLEGWVLFLFALALLVLCHTMINRVYRLFHKTRKEEPSHA
jgi:exosortase